MQCCNGSFQALAAFEFRPRPAEFRPDQSRLSRLSRRSWPRSRLSRLKLQKLTIVAGALSVGIGFGLQSIVNNFVSGLILLWERAVRVGDSVVVGADQGFVRRINVRSTEIETFDRSQVIIPNSNLVSGVVTNLVRNDRTGRVVIPLTIAACANPERVREAACDRQGKSAGIDRTGPANPVYRNVRQRAQLRTARLRRRRGDRRAC